MTPGDVVLDASALLRALLGQSPDAVQLLDRIVAGELRGVARDLIDAEATHALVRLTHAGVLPAKESRRITASLRAVPIDRKPATELTPAALEQALASGLSTHDGLHAVLAQALAAPSSRTATRLTRGRTARLPPGHVPCHVSLAC